MIRSVIAIGSNSTRMLTADVFPGTVSVLHRDRIETSLFLGLNKNHNLSDRAISTVSKAVSTLRQRSFVYGNRGEIPLLATSAVRDASNQQVLSDRLLEDSKLHLQILSGKEEAELAFIAASRGRTCMAADIGGGSTEITCGTAGISEMSISLQLGASRLMKIRPIESAGDADYFIRYALSMIREQVPSFPSGMNDCFVGIGGTLTTLACVYQGSAALNTNTEYTVSTESMTEVLYRLSCMSLPERAAIPGIPPGREKHIVHGLCILQALCEHFMIRQINVSFRTNMDGYLLREAETLRG